MTLQSRNAIRAGDIATELQTARRSMLRYTFDQDEASFAKIQKSLSKISELLDEAAKTTPFEERRALYKNAIKEIVELSTKRAALGEAIKQMQAGRNLLFTDGDQMAADVQKFVDAAAKTDVSREVSALETKVLLVRIANSKCWRPAIPRASRPSRPISRRRSSRSQSLKRPICRPILRRSWRRSRQGSENMPKHLRRPDRTSCSEMNCTTRALPR